MRFLNTRFSQEITLDTINNSSEQREPVTNLIQGETLITPMPGNLMSKFYRYQTISNTEAPETFYENEAWAPKDEGIGLFRKRRMNVE